MTAELSFVSSVSTTFVKFNASVSLRTHQNPTEFEYYGIGKTVFLVPFVVLVIYCVFYSVFAIEL